MKQIGVRLTKEEYSTVKNVGRLLSSTQIIPSELNDSEIFSILINYAWMKDRENSKVVLKTGYGGSKSINDMFRMLYGKPGDPLRAMQAPYKKTKILKTLVLPDETYEMLEEATEFNKNKRISESVRDLVLSEANSHNAYIDLVTWMLAYDVFSRSMLETSAGKVKLISLKEDMIMIRVPKKKVTVYAYDRKNFKHITEMLDEFKDFEYAEQEGINMTDLSKKMTSEFKVMGIYTDIAAREGGFDYPEGFNAQAATANYMWCLSLPYVALRKLFTISVVSDAVKKVTNNGAPVAEVQDSGILDIVAESLITRDLRLKGKPLEPWASSSDDLGLDVNHNLSYKAFMKWIYQFKEYVDKNAYTGNV